MTVNRIVDYFRDGRTGNGIPNRTVSLRKVSDGLEIATVQTDVNGKFAFTDADVTFEDGQIYYLVDDGSGTYKRHSGQSFGQIGPIWFDALVKAFSGLGKGVMSGFAVSADGSGMTVAVSAGVAIGKDGIPYWNEADTLAIAAADGSNPRIDLVVLRVTRVGQTDEGKVVPTVITGTPAGSPVAPSPTASSATDDIVLAQVLVDAGAGVISSGKVTDKRFDTAGQAVLSVPLMGDAIGDAQIDTQHLVDDAVTTAKIDAGAVTATELGSSAVTNTKIMDNAVTYSKIDAGAVTTTRLGDLAVTNAKVATGIDAVKIADGSVTNAEFQYLANVTSDIQSQIDGKADDGSYATTTHTHTQVAQLFGKATNAHSAPVSVGTSQVTVANFNLGPLVSGVVYDVVAYASGQANAASGGTITAYVRIQAGGTPEAGYGTATVGGERQIEAFHGEAVTGAGATINIAFRAQSTNSGASVNGALVWATATPRNVPAS